MQKFMFCTFTAAAAVVLLAVPASAHFDILVYTDNTKLLTGTFEHGTSATDLGPVRVYEVEVEFDGAGNPWEGHDLPGFHALSSSGLPPGESIGFDFMPITIGGTTRNLWYWDGSGGVNFGTLTGSHELTLQEGAFSASITGTSNSLVPGFSIATPDSNGAFDGHVDTLLGLGGGEPPLGIYLASLQLNHAGGLQPSDPLFLVYATYDEGGQITGDMHDDAMDWVLANLVNGNGGPPVIPEPGSLALLAIGAGVLLCVRRRGRRARGADV